MARHWQGHVPSTTLSSAIVLRMVDLPPCLESEDWTLVLFIFVGPAVPSLADIKGQKGQKGSNQKHIEHPHHKNKHGPSFRVKYLM